jgi:hypothetical protein
MFTGLYFVTLTMVKFNLFQQVVLWRDLPGHDLRRGDVATIVEVIEKENKTATVLNFLIMKEIL